MGEESGCKEYGCSYTKVGGNQGDVYCFQSGDYTTALDECSSLPTTAPTTPGTTLPPTSIDSSDKVTETLENIGSRKSELETAAASVSGETKEKIEDTVSEIIEEAKEIEGTVIEKIGDIVDKIDLKSIEMTWHE